MTSSVPCSSNEGPSMATDPAAVTSREPASEITTMSAATTDASTRISCIGRRARRGRKASKRTETMAAPPMMRIGAIAA